MSLLVRAREKQLSGDFKDALRLYTRELERQKSHEALRGEALALLSLQFYDEAEVRLKHVINQWPRDVVAMTNLASLYHNVGKDEKAEWWIGKAVEESNPLAPQTAYNWGLIQLKRGNWTEGWLGYEYRFMVGEAKMAAPFETYWQGQPMEPDQTLFVWGEQGLGDQIQYARLVNQAKELCGTKVILVVDPRLIRLFDGLADEVYDRMTMGPRDLHCPIVSLARILGVTPENLNGESFLPASQKRAPVPGRIGIAWRTDTPHRLMRDRVLPTELVDELRKEPFEWVCLQYGEENFTPRDFQETAEVAATCEKIATIDTSIVHLAGGMGIPTLLMLRYQRDLRWLQRDRVDTPWYDSVRLYTCPSPGDWRPVIDEVKRDLNA
jgi:hypothetical protein